MPCGAASLQNIVRSLHSTQMQQAARAKVCYKTLWGALYLACGSVDCVEQWFCGAAQQNKAGPPASATADVCKQVSLHCTRVATPDTPAGWMKRLRTGLLRRTWGWWLMKNSTWPSHEHSETRKAIRSWVASGAAWAAGQWRGFCSSALLQ